MAPPLNPTDFLFAKDTQNEPTISISTHDPLPSISTPTTVESTENTTPQPHNIFVNEDEVVFSENSQTLSNPGAPSLEDNLLLPYFLDAPVIETASFKAYLILVEDNIFLQNDAAGGSRSSRRRAQRGELLAAANGMSAGGAALGHELPEHDANPRHTVVENAGENTSSTHEINTEDGVTHEHDDDDDAEGADLPPTMLRGILLFRVLKNNTKIKNIDLNFHGDSRTNWPEGIPPKKTEFVELETLMNCEWNFFDVHDHSSPKYQKGGADHINTLPDHVSKKDIDVDIDNLDLNDPGMLSANLFSSITAVTSNSSQRSSRTSKFLGGLSKNVFSKATNVTQQISNTARKSLDLAASASKLDSDSVSIYNLGANSSPHGKLNHIDSQGNYVFHQGDYIYNFEHKIAQSTPESLNLTFGFVNYWLNLEIGRIGKFKSALRAKKKVNLIRTNSSQSIEDNFDPILINKSWEDRLNYSILIASNSVILNSFMPINIRVVPTDKNVKLYKIKIFIIEILEYWCKKRKVHRLEPQRKFLLLEHKPKVGTNLLRDFEDLGFNNSIISDKNTSDKKNSHQRSTLNVNDSSFVYSNDNSAIPQNIASNLIGHTAQNNSSKKIEDSKHNGKKKTKKPKKSLEDDEEEYISSKDFNYQLYVPEMFSKFSSKLHPDAKHKNIQCHHWIKISLRLSKKIDEFDLADDDANARNLPESSSDVLRSVAHNNDGALSDMSDNGGSYSSHGSRRPSIASRKKSDSTGSALDKPKRKHYEISIDSPINLLHPLCTQANTLLPAYDGVGMYDPYTYAKKKESGEIEILTNNNPLFPPEILSTDGHQVENFNPTQKLNNVLDDELRVTSAIDAHRKPAIPTEEIFENGDSESHMPTGEDYTTLDNEFQSDITPDMISSNLYSPRAVDLDLVAVQAQPMKPNLHSVGMSPQASSTTNGNIDNLLSPISNGPNTIELSPARTARLSPNLSPNFRALSPTLQALSPTLNGNVKSSASSIKSPLLLASNAPVAKTNSIFGEDAKDKPEMHLLTKPPIKPPTYHQSVGKEPLMKNGTINRLLLANSEEQIARAGPPPSYEDAIESRKHLTSLIRWQGIDNFNSSTTARSSIDHGGSDVAETFSFRGEDPNIPAVVARAASPKISASNSNGFPTNENEDSSSKLINQSSTSTGFSAGVSSVPNIMDDGDDENADVESLELKNDSFVSLPSVAGNGSVNSSLALNDDNLPANTFERSDKLPLLLSEREHGSSTSVFGSFPSRVSTQLNNTSLTSLWNPLSGLGGNTPRNQITPKLYGADTTNDVSGARDDDISRSLDDDSKNDLGLL
ncbi:Aly2 protein [Saccharomycopsis crataegensis]|uniref:Aly2 protein n=1 Tax=Saccharomycopsis crataegensis TaxID=43959 RepID=A0AAV5QK96_9ASCO|nr:Aly2 protein [Saccharomycopsis crataegensis]